MSILFAILKLWWDWSEKTNQETAIGVTFNQKFIFNSKNVKLFLMSKIYVQKQL